MKNELPGSREMLRRTGSPLDFKVMTDKKFEEHETKSRSRGETNVHEPEGCGRHRLEKTADPPDKTIGAKERQIIESDHRGIDCFRRVFGE